MANKWKDGAGEKLSFKNPNEIEEIPPKSVIKRVEKWCINGNSQTFGDIKNKLWKDDEATKIILNVINFKILNNQEFTVKDIIKLTNSTNLTDGSLQRKILAKLTCFGILIKEVRETKYDKRPYYIFKKNINIIPCPYLKIEEKNNKLRYNCVFNFTHSKYETNYFDNNKKGEKDE